MAQQVKLFGAKMMPISCRAEIALKFKGVQYEFVQEDMSNSADYLRKKIPVLVHNDKYIADSTVVIEYIDEAFNGPKILPEDPYERAIARFWAKFLEEKVAPSIRKALWDKAEEQEKEKATEEAIELLLVLEKQLKGNKFYGGDRIGLVDMVAVFVGYWLGISEEVIGKKLVTKEKFPKLTEWMDAFISCSPVKECLPPQDAIVEAICARFNKA